MGESSEESDINYDDSFSFPKWEDKFAFLRNKWSAQFKASPDMKYKDVEVKKYKNLYKYENEYPRVKQMQQIYTFQEIHRSNKHSNLNDNDQDEEDLNYNSNKKFKYYKQNSFPSSKSNKNSSECYTIRKNNRVWKENKTELKKHYNVHNSPNRKYSSYSSSSDESTTSNKYNPEKNIRHIQRNSRGDAYEKNGNYFRKINYSNRRQSSSHYKQSKNNSSKMRSARSSAGFDILTPEDEAEKEESEKSVFEIHMGESRIMDSIELQKQKSKIIVDEKEEETVISSDKNSCCNPKECPKSFITFEQVCTCLENLNKKCQKSAQQECNEKKQANFDCPRSKKKMKSKCSSNATKKEDCIKPTLCTAVENAQCPQPNFDCPRLQQKRKPKCISTIPINKCPTFKEECFKPTICEDEDNLEYCPSKADVDCPRSKKKKKPKCSSNKTKNQCPRMLSVKPTICDSDENFQYCQPNFYCPHLKQKKKSCSSNTPKNQCPIIRITSDDEEYSDCCPSECLQSYITFKNLCPCVNKVDKKTYCSLKKSNKDKMYCKTPKHKKCQTPNKKYVCKTSTDFCSTPTSSTSVSIGTDNESSSCSQIEMSCAEVLKLKQLVNNLKCTPMGDKCIPIDSCESIPSCRLKKPKKENNFCTQTEKSRTIVYNCKREEKPKKCKREKFIFNEDSDESINSDPEVRTCKLRRPCKNTCPLKVRENVCPAIRKCTEKKTKRKCFPPEYDSSSDSDSENNRHIKYDQSDSEDEDEDSDSESEDSNECGYNDDDDEETEEDEPEICRYPKCPMKEKERPECAQKKENLKTCSPEPKICSNPKCSLKKSKSLACVPRKKILKPCSPPKENNECVKPEWTKICKYNNKPVICYEIKTCKCEDKLNRRPSKAKEILKRFRDLINPPKINKPSAPFCLHSSKPISQLHVNSLCPCNAIGSTVLTPDIISYLSDDKEKGICTSSDRCCSKLSCPYWQDCTSQPNQICFPRSKECCENEYEPIFVISPNCQENKEPLCIQDEPKCTKIETENNCACNQVQVCGTTEEKTKTYPGSQSCPKSVHFCTTDLVHCIPSNRHVDVKPRCVVLGNNPCKQHTRRSSNIFTQWKEYLCPRKTASITPKHRWLKEMLETIPPKMYDDVPDIQFKFVPPSNKKKYHVVKVKKVCTL